MKILNMIVVVTLGCALGIAFPISVTEPTATAEAGVVKIAGQAFATGAFEPQRVTREAYTVTAAPVFIPIEGDRGPYDPDGWRTPKPKPTKPAPVLIPTEGTLGPIYPCGMTRPGATVCWDGQTVRPIGPDDTIFLPKPIPEDYQLPTLPIEP